MVFYHRHHGRLPFDFEQLERLLVNWNVWVISTHRPIAVVITKDGEAHIAAYKTEKVGIKAMKWALDALHITRTAVRNEFAPGHALAKRLGFQVDQKSNEVTRYVRL